MHCCSSKGCDEFFSERVARHDARRYRRRGLDASARRLLALLRRRGLTGRTVLEIGGGVGAIQLELLRAGAAHAVNIELSPAYEPYAAELLREAGMEGRVGRRVFDFAEQADEVESADIVVLHKVVCCYPDYEALVGAAADHTRRQLVMTFPREAWWMRLGIAGFNLIQRLRRKTFRVYLHPPAAMLAVAWSRQLQTVGRQRSLLGELAGLERPA
jgi:magnesium-protoporphyrin O-methyltransferase